MRIFSRHYSPLLRKHFSFLRRTCRTLRPSPVQTHRTQKSSGLDEAGAETVKKGLCPFLTKGLQSAARTICTPLAYKSYTCSLSCIFCQVQEVNCPEGARETTLGCAPTENDQNPFAACGRQTLRGFFDTLGSPFGRAVTAKHRVGGCLTPLNFNLTEIIQIAKTRQSGLCRECGINSRIWDWGRTDCCRADCPAASGSAQ